MIVFLESISFLYIVPFRQDLGENPFTRCLAVLWNMLTRRTAPQYISILFILIVGLVSSLMHYEIFEVLKGAEISFAITTIIWLFVLYSSLNSIYLYYSIFYSNFQTIENSLQTSVGKYGYKPVLLVLVCLSFALFTIHELVLDMHKWSSKLKYTDIESPVIWLYYALWISRLLYNILSCELIDTGSYINISLN